MPRPGSTCLLRPDAVGPGLPVAEAAASAARRATVCSRLQNATEAGSDGSSLLPPSPPPSDHRL